MVTDDEQSVEQQIVPALTYALLADGADVAERLWRATMRCECDDCGDCPGCTGDIAKLTDLGYVVDGRWVV